jgi:spermidine synthase
VNRRVGLAVGALGVMAAMTQLALMREMLGVFSGNELALGVILGNWLLLTGLGSWLGRTAGRMRHPQRTLALLLIAVALLPLAQVFTLRELRNVVFVRGATIGLSETVTASFLWLAPFCVVSGYTLTLACGALATPQGSGAIGAVYVADSVGSVLGGALFTYVLVRRLDHFALLSIPALACLLVAGWLAWHERQLWVVGAAGIMAAGLVVTLVAMDVDGASTARLFTGQRVVFRGNSPYGKLVVTEFAGQLNFIENGVPVIATHNIEEVEETVHYAMSQRPRAQRVLLIAGGVSGTAREILKYGVAEVTYVELDPLIITVGRRFLPASLADPRIRVLNTDGRLFVKHTQETFDVVIVDMPLPSTSQINRFFTSEFFDEVKRVLAPGGVLAFSLGHYENFVSPELARVLASASATLQRTFRHQLVIPGGRVFFLASDGELYADISTRIEQSGVSTRLVNRHYLSAVLTPDRLADMQRATAAPATVNTDFNPVLYYYHLRHWMSQFRERYGLWAIVLVSGFAAYLARTRAVPFAIFASGFAASALEVVLLLGFQILCGSVYRQVGVIITMFMAGLAVGASAATRYRPIGNRIPLAGLALGIALLAAILPAGLKSLEHAPVPIIQAAIALLTLVLACMVGMEFPLATRTSFRDVAGTASRLYTADFTGACLGALLASTLLIPLLGVTATCLLAGGVNAVSAVWLLAGGTR